MRGVERCLQRRKKTSPSDTVERAGRQIDSLSWTLAAKPRRDKLIIARNVTPVARQQCSERRDAERFIQERDVTIRKQDLNSAAMKREQLAVSLAIDKARAGAGARRAGGISRRQ